MKIIRLLKQRKNWIFLAPLLTVALLLAVVFGDPFSGTALGRYQSLISGMLILPVIAAVYSCIQMIISDQVLRRVNDLFEKEDHHGEGRPARSSTPSPAQQAETEAAVQDEVDTISERLKEALTTLRKRNFRKGVRRGRRLYQLPWYVVIGPPGSGKTTMILNSGLRFPLAGRHGAGPMQGVGGTRHCDWWFTDDAVLIDTAGRYATQDEPTGAERGAWLGFLRLLGKHRRREPINGIMLVVGLDEIMGSAQSRRDNATRIRERVNELYEELGLRIPIYVVISKLDLVAGFLEFYDYLGHEARDAVWGMTFDLPTPGDPEDARPVNPCESFRIEFDVLVDRVDGILADRLQQEGDSRRRGRIFGFPQRMASLREPLAQFLDDVFSPNSYEDSVLLRGVYLTSGTQPPQRVDAQVMVNANTRPDLRSDPRAASFGQVATRDPMRAAAVAGDGDEPSGRSYFLKRLLREVIFNEAGLVAADPRKLRRNRRSTVFAHAAIAGVAAAVGIAMIGGYLRNSAAANSLSHSLQSVSEDAGALDLQIVRDPALLDIVPLIDRLEAARDEAAQPRFGQAIYDRPDRIATTGRNAYAHALHKLLLPRLVLGAEQAMKRKRDDTAATYLALKVYLMLGGRGPVDADTIRRWSAVESLTAMPGAENAALRRKLDSHVAVLLAQPFQPFAVDQGAIDAARAALPARSAAARVLDEITSGEEARALAPWRLIDNAGPDADQVFADRRGAIEATQVAGIYTRAGFHGQFLPRLSQVARDEARDLWVLEDRPDAQAGNTDALAAELASDATELYLRELSLQWDETLASITIRPMPTLGDALRIMNTLSSPSSPIRLLLVSIVEQTAFDRPIVTPGQPAADPSAAGVLAEDPLQGDALALAARQRAASFAATHFRDVRALIEVPSNSQQGALPPIDQVIADLQLLYRRLRDVQSTDVTGPLDETAEAMLILRQVTAGSSRLPEPVRGWVSEISTSSVNQQASSAREALNRRWQDGPAALCREVTSGRYPFAANTRSEADLAKFGALFGPDGEIDRFTRTNLDRILDRSEPQWRWREVEGIGGALSPEALAAMQQADRIRQAMFAGNSQRPAVSFQMVLIRLEPARGSVRVVMNGQNTEMKSSGGDQVLRLHWPAPEGLGRASVSFPQFMSSGREPGVAGTGDWALYRLLDQAQRQFGSDGGGALRARFQSGDRVASFVIQADTVVNPLDRRLLSGFSCPEAF